MQNVNRSETNKCFKIIINICTVDDKGFSAWAILRRPPKAQASLLIAVRTHEVW